MLLNTEATPEMVAAMNPDAIIIAVGGYEAQPPIPGLKDVPHMSGTEAIEHDFSKEDNIAILGGGTIGAEIGLELSEKEHKHVTVVEMGDKVAAQGNMLYKIALQQKIDACDTLDIKLNTACQTIDGNTMTVKDSDGEHTLKFDHLVVSTGVRPKDSLAESFYGIAPETNMIGDCVRPRKIMDAIFEGHTVAMSL
ncbi:Metal reductase [Lactiplantibacillus plantarum]|nr:Metal reductase [Lactiplantibacillus plantarum]